MAARMEKSPPEAVVVQMAEAKVMAENDTLTGPLAPSRLDRSVVPRKTGVIHLLSRFFCMVTSITALLFMVTAEESGIVTIYGFELPLYSKWSFAGSFEYLVGVSAAASAYSLLQLLISGLRLQRKSPVIPSKNHVWLMFVGDQVFAYTMMSAGSAASGVTNLNRTGIRHTALPNFCKPLHTFCDHIAISVVFSFFSCLLLAASAFQEVIWLSKY